MFTDMIGLVFGGCTNPMEYVLALLLFYMILDEVVNLLGTLVNAARR